MRICLFLAAVGMSTSALGADIIVRGDEDTGLPGTGSCAAAGCSYNSGLSAWECDELRRAIECSNALTSTDTITFDAGYTYYNLGTVVTPGVAPATCGWDDTNILGDIDITDDVTLLGNGRLDTIIDARVITTKCGTLTDGRAVQVHGVTVTFEDIQVREGYNIIDPNRYLGYPFLPTGGGCIRNDGGDVTLDNVVLYSCASSGIWLEEGGGGLWGSSTSTTTITGSLIDTNTAYETLGGGIQTFGELIMSDSIVARNASDVGGGGLALHGDFEIEDTNIGNNSAVMVGGGILIDNAGATTATIKHSSIAENNQTATWDPPRVWRGGGGVAAMNGGIADFQNVTVGQNGAAGHGGGVYTFVYGGPSPSLTFDFTTFAGNYSSSRAAYDGTSCAGASDCSFSESIVDDHCWGGVSSSGENLETSSSCLGFSLTGGFADLSGLEAASNGNGTQIYHLGASSDALGAATPGSCPSDDQEGDSRAYICDLGADES